MKLSEKQAIALLQIAMDSLGTAGTFDLFKISKTDRMILVEQIMKQQSQAVQELEPAAGVTHINCGHTNIDACPHCLGDKKIRNPSGFCDHLQYPDYCKICTDREGKKTVRHF